MIDLDTKRDGICFYNKNIAVGSAIQFAEEFKIDIAVIDKGNSLYQIMLDKEVGLEDLENIVYITRKSL